MRLLRIAGLLLMPALLHAGYLNIEITAGCGCSFGICMTEVTASYGSAICTGPGSGIGRAQASFGNSGVHVSMSGDGAYPDRNIYFRGEVTMEAAYQITFFGAQGPGFMEVSACVSEDGSGVADAWLVTPNGSIRSSQRAWQTWCVLEDIPIVFGVPLDARLSLQGSASGRCCGVGGTGSASLNLTYQALDAIKQPVSSTAEIVVPEPSTWQLCMAGASLLILAGATAGVRPA